jgi:hypothetical protein
MKTLKQIREEYNGKFTSQVESLPEELMLENKGMATYKDMPSLLIFRRLSFRLYPKNQVVALYYSKLLDKYLSIPFGPGGNVNLGEAVVYDTLDEACWDNYKQEGMKKKGNKMVPNCVPVEEQGSSATRYTERPTYEHFKENIEKLREERMNEGLADVADTVADIAIPYYSAGKKLYKGDYKGAAKDAAVDTAMMAVGGPLTRVAAKGLKAGAGIVRKGIGKLTGKTAEKGIARDASAIAKSAKSPKLASKSSSPIKSAAGGAAAGAAAGAASGSSAGSDLSKDTIVKGLYRGTPHGKAYSSWETGSDKDPVYQSRLKQAQLRENKITDIRTMVKEGVENMDLSINGRSVTLNTSMAKRILEVYDSVNTKNKKIVEGMLNEDLESFKKLLNFSVRN